MTKKEIITALKKAAEHQKALADLDRATDLFCYVGMERPTIQIASQHWNEVVEALDANVKYNTEYTRTHDEAYFFMNLNRRKYKLFTVLNKGGSE